MSREPCVCGASRSLQTFDDGQYCHACHKQFNSKKLIVKKQEKKILEMPKDTNVDGNIRYGTAKLPKEVDIWLQQFYFTAWQLEVQKEVFWSEEYQRICFPFNNNKSCWMRTLDKTSKNKWVFVGEKSLYWLNSNIDYSGQAEFLIVTEDVISCIRCNEFSDSVALGGTNVNNKLLLPILLNYDKIIVWLDGDKAGKTASQVFYDRYKHLKDIQIIHTLKDPKCYSPSEIKEILNND